MVDEIFKNNDKISTKCPPTNFWGRRLRIYYQIYKIQYGGFKMVDDILEKNCSSVNTIKNTFFNYLRNN